MPLVRRRTLRLHGEGAFRLGFAALRLGAFPALRLGATSTTTVPGRKRQPVGIVTQLPCSSLQIACGGRACKGPVGNGRDSDDCVHHRAWHDEHGNGMRTHLLESNEADTNNVIRWPLRHGNGAVWADRRRDQSLSLPRRRQARPPGRPALRLRPAQGSSTSSSSSLHSVSAVMSCWSTISERSWKCDLAKAARSGSWHADPVCPTRTTA